tara:strand:- start:720 stop:914 length:195 start_codon:yes stop_codon:yes gene_type:complete
MNIDKREAKALIKSMTSLLNSLDQNFDSLPTDLNDKVKEAKMLLLNVDMRTYPQRKIYRILGLN